MENEKTFICYQIILKVLELVEDVTEDALNDTETTTRRNIIDSNDNDTHSASHPLEFIPSHNVKLDYPIKDYSWLPLNNGPEPGILYDEFGRAVLKRDEEPIFRDEWYVDKRVDEDEYMAIKPDIGAGRPMNFQYPSVETEFRNISEWAKSRENSIGDVPIGNFRDPYNAANVPDIRVSSDRKIVPYFSGSQQNFHRISGGNFYNNRIQPWRKRRYRRNIPAKLPVDGSCYFAQLHSGNVFELLTATAFIF